MRRFLLAVPRVLGSYATAVVLLCLMLALTYLGTWAQVHQSIYDIQREYFESWFVMARWEVMRGVTIPVPLPGAMVLLGLLAINLVVGGILRLKHRMQKVGVLITHIGILVLLGAGVVEFFFSDKGNLALFEGAEGDEFQSYNEWDVVVTEPLPGGRVREHVVPYERMGQLGTGGAARFTSDALPFDLRVSGWLRNCHPEGVDSGGVDGFLLHDDGPMLKSEQEVPGLLATVVVKGGTAPTFHGLLWGLQRFPWRVEVDGKGWDLDLRRRRWQVPFRLRLDHFVAAFHPHTNRPKEFSSYVVKIEEGTQQAVHITMNQPLRHEGYTFFQSSYDGPYPPADPKGAPVWRSVFSVVRNPADRWPILACLVIGLGLITIMAQKLGRYLKAQRRSLA